MVATRLKTRTSPPLFYALRGHEEHEGVWAAKEHEEY
jgi:hypothetical protein